MDMNKEMAQRSDEEVRESCAATNKRQDNVATQQLTTSRRQSNNEVNTRPQSSNTVTSVEAATARIESIEDKSAIVREVCSNMRANARRDNFATSSRRQSHAAGSIGTEPFRFTNNVSPITKSLEARGEKRSTFNNLMEAKRRLGEALDKSKESGRYLNSSVAVNATLRVPSSHHAKDASLVPNSCNDSLLFVSQHEPLPEVVNRAIATDSRLVFEAFQRKINLVNPADMQQYAELKAIIIDIMNKIQDNRFDYRIELVQLLSSLDLDTLAVKIKKEYKRDPREDSFAIRFVKVLDSLRNDHAVQKEWLKLLVKLASNYHGPGKRLTYLWFNNCPFRSMFLHIHETGTDYFLNDYNRVLDARARLNK